MIRIVMGSAGSGEGAPNTRLLNQLLQALRWQRTVAKELGELPRSAELADEAQQLQHALEQMEANREAEAAKVSAVGGAGGTSSEFSRSRPLLLEPVICCRNEVRAALLEFKRVSKGSDAASKAESSKQQLERVLEAADELEKVVVEAEAEEAKAASEAKADAKEARDSNEEAGAEVGGSTAPMEEEGGCEADSDAALRDTCSAFVSELRSAAAEHGSASGFVARAFDACDALRSRLRAEGTTLTDMQTEGAYQSRVSQMAA